MYAKWVEGRGNNLRHSWNISNYEKSLLRSWSNFKPYFVFNHILWFLEHAKVNLWTSFPAYILHYSGAVCMIRLSCKFMSSHVIIKLSSSHISSTSPTLSSFLSAKLRQMENEFGESLNFIIIISSHTREYQS